MWRALLWLCFLSVQAVAQSFPDLPARFVRIYTMEELQGTGFYAIGALSDGELYFMRQKPTTEVSEKLSVAKAGVLQEAYTLTTNINFWKISKIAEGWTIEGDTTPSYLVPAGTNNFKQGSQPTPWIFSTNNDGTFTLVASSQPDYGVDIRGKTPHYFGRYKILDSHAHLYLYKLATAEATAPADGSEVALCAQGRGELNALDGSRLSLQSTRGYLLVNDTIAPGKGIGTWRADYANDTDFSLTTAAGQTLCVTDGRLDLCPRSAAGEQASWRVDDGLITWVGNPGAPLALCAVTDDTSTTIQLLSPEAYQASGASAFHFHPVGAPPIVTKAPDGVWQLSGAWSADTLSRLALTGATALDLTRVSLPRHATPLAIENPNMLVYVRAAEADYAPQEWPHVVAVSNQSCQAVCPIALHDKYPFHTPYPFVAAQGISYEREAHADHGWETLCLPFDVAQLPLGFVGETFDGLQGADIRFTPVQSVPANTPLIIAYTGEETAGTVPFQVSATGVTVRTATNSTTAGLAGNYLPFVVGEREGRCYLLNATGDTFVLSDAASTLAPFRAYLETTATRHTINVRHTQTTGLHSPSLKNKTSESYRPDGRRWPKNKPAHGILIRDGKKYISK